MREERERGFEVERGEQGAQAAQGGCGEFHS
jgi:hypothetical protein